MFLNIKFVPLSWMFKRHQTPVKAKGEKYDQFFFNLQPFIIFCTKLLKQKFSKYIFYMKQIFQKLPQVHFKMVAVSNFLFYKNRTVNIDRTTTVCDLGTSEIEILNSIACRFLYFLHIKMYKVF